MGNSGLERAKSLYDWKHIIPQYEDLWRESAEIRKSASSTSRKTVPSRLDPFSSFSHYATVHITEATQVELVYESADAALGVFEEMRALEMVSYAEYVHPSPSETSYLLSAISEGQRTCGELLVNVDSVRKAFLLRGIGVLLKLGIIRKVH